MANERRLIFRALRSAESNVLPVNGSKRLSSLSLFQVCRKRNVLVLIMLVVAEIHQVNAQGSQFAIPCPAPPSGSCSASSDSSIVDAKDYYDLSIMSVCVNYPDSFWHNKLISLQVTVTAAAQAPRPVPIYNARAQSSCMIGVNGFALVNSVPFDGNNLTVQTDMYRSNSSDGLQKILAFAGGTSQQAIFTNYASAAIPFLNAATASINSAITTFGQSQQPWLTGTGISFTTANAGQVQNSDLREGFFVQYQGPSNINDASFYVDGNDLRWTSTRTLVRDPQSAWILFHIRKRESRINMTNSPWYSAWIKALNGVKTGTVDGPALTKAMQAASVILSSDNDYTSGDRDTLTSNIADATRQITTLLSVAAPNFAAIRTAIDAAEQPEGSQVPSPQLIAVPIGTPDHPVADNHTGAAAIALPEPVVQTIITPERLAMELRTLAIPRQ